MSAGRSSTEKPPKIKGLVKRCRSFKEDILSRLARNRSLGKDDSGGGQRHSTSSRVVSPTGGWSSEGPSPVPSDSTGATEPLMVVTHRLKEAYLTLQFVESLIQKNCVDLLGGSSNVMLDLMGCLLNDIKKTSVSDSAAYQSAISQIKTTLSEFLTAVDVLLLKDRCDEAQREVYFEKVLDTLRNTRDALTRLKNLIDTKENGHNHNSNNSNIHSYQSHNHGSDKKGTFLTSTPKSKTEPSSPGSKSESASYTEAVSQNTTGSTPVLPLTETDSKPNDEKRPPLPPKLKQWSAKSFDMDWSSKSPTSPQHNSNNLYTSSHSNLPPQQCNPTSLLQWIEQTSISAANNHNSKMRSTSNSNTNTVTSSSSTVLYQSQSSGGQSGSQSHGHHSRSQSQKQNVHHASTSSNSKYELSTSQNWTDSSIYIARSSTASSSHSQSKILVSTSNHNSSYLDDRRNRNRTYSDSYRIDCSDESLDKLLPDYDCRSQSARSGTTHNSQSLSLGSSLDNLLLVDGLSQQSGLSPNSNSGGAHGANRVSVSSSGATGTGLAGLSNYDPDTDADGETDNVFVTEVPTNRLSGVGCNENQKTEMTLHVTTEEENESESESPPELPEKTSFNRNRHFLLGGNNLSSNNSNMRYMKAKNDPRCPSPYDNVDETDLGTWHGITTRPDSGFFQQQSSKQFMSYSESRNTLVGASGGFDSEERPPLPPKKKHSLITAYVELMHNFDSHTNHLNHHHHHFHNHQNQAHHAHYPEGGNYRQYLSERSATLYNPSTGGIPGFSGLTTVMNRASYSSSIQHISSFSMVSPSDDVSPTRHQHPFQLLGQQSTENTSSASISPSPASSESGNMIENGGRPPALPPKRTKNFLRSSMSEQGEHPLVSSKTHHPPPLVQCTQSPVGSPVRHLAPSPTNPMSSSNNLLGVVETPGVGPGSIGNSMSSLGPPPSTAITSVTTPVHCFSGRSAMESPQLSIDEENKDLYILDASAKLTLNESLNAPSTNGKAPCDGPEVKGADPHVLLVYAASPDLKDMKFREVFLLTYRNFVRPIDVINLLWKRYQHFEKKSDRTFIVHARTTLDLFVDVVNSLTPMDLDDDMVATVRKCIYHLVNCGEIQCALKSRKGLIVKYEVRLKLLSPKPAPVSLAVTTEGQTLLQFSATSIAQQMTLLDAELFRHLEPAELLLWAREQTEDFCPALNNFTEHFNKVSYWARSKVLLCANSRERNRTMKKLIEVMRKLRDYNNFNSLLAVLAALDSAPIRRLGFSRRLTEALKPHAALTDSSGSFRTYRQALAESKPPCIPYIGLVLQDLTFVHIGNADLLADGKVNWIKRWQQWVVLEPIRRFHACQYGYIRNDSLLAFLNNFDESLNDDDLWQLSEQIKPRGKN